MECNTTGMPKSLVLFTTSMCPNCKPVKAELEKTQLDYSIIVLDVAENGKEIAAHWGITAVPTLLVVEDGVVNGHINGVLKDGVPSGRFNNPREIVTHVRALQRDLLQEQSGGEPEGGSPVLRSSGEQEHIGTCVC